MGYPVENALYQWEDGERRLAEAGDASLHPRIELLVEQLRKRLGSAFEVSELADFYAAGFDVDEPAWLVDAAFARYAREARDFAGGRRLSEAERRG